MKGLFLSNNGQNFRLLYSLLVVFSAVAALYYFSISTTNTVNAETSAPQATFPGTGVGAIPDGNAGTPPQYGTPLVINFAVTGVSGPVTSVSANVTLSHTWVGDVDMVLRAPGGTPSLVLVSRIGVTTATSFGSASDYSGTYTFTDSAAGTNIWTAAAATPVPAGSYRTTAPGQAGQTNPPPVTSLNTTFGGLTPAQANGTWTLTVRDAASADIGTVTAANLTVNPTGPLTPVDAANDINGDGRSDYVVVRNVGGGSGGQVGWFYNTAGTGDPTVWINWGISTDFFLLEDYDGDQKDDITVWRATEAGGSKFYILQSMTNTVRIDVFGEPGDTPKVAGDYDGDGKADVAVYRSGLASGDQSTWFYRGSLTPANITYVPWGQNGDFEAPGDYDGDGKNDFVVQRNNGGGQARFWRRYATGATDTVVFGTPTDNISPGDYDGDGKTDLMVYRGIGGQLNWFLLSSQTGLISQFVYGLSATDFSTQGDYDGDGKTDISVWRPNVDPTQNFFYWRSTASGATTIFELGQNGDYPVANWNRH